VAEIPDFDPPQGNTQRVMRKIEALSDNSGVSVDQLMEELDGIITRGEVRRIIKRLMSEAVVYAPRPGFVRKLG